MNSDDVWLKVFDPFVEAWVERRFRAHVFDHNDRTLRLFPVGVLALCLGRTRPCIHGWEKEGKFPKAIYTVAGSKTKRWYSEYQIKLAQQLQRALLGDNPARTNNQHANHSAFFLAVTSKWRAEEDRT